MFRFNNIVWNIYTVGNDNKILYRSDGTRTIGVTDRKSHSIYIARSLRGELLKKVLLHEITHAAVFSYGIYLSLDQEEKLCNFVATFAPDIVSITEGTIKAATIATAGPVTA